MIEIVNKKNDIDKPLVEMFLKIDTYDKDGKLIEEGERIRSKSFVRAFAELLNIQMAQRDATIRDITNTLRGGTPQSLNLSSIFAAGDARGIVVGTGTTHVDANNFNLAVPIPHGAATGQLMYDASTCSLVSVTATRTSFTLNRNIRNDSGANITINEVGIIVFSNTAGVHPPPPANNLIVRDVITARTILPLQTLHVMYELVFNI